MKPASKPDPAMLARILDFMVSSPEQAVMIGDTFATSWHGATHWYANPSGGGVGVHKRECLASIRPTPLLKRSTDLRQVLVLLKNKAAS